MSHPLMYRKGTVWWCKAVSLVLGLYYDHTVVIGVSRIAQSAQPHSIYN